MTTLLPTFAVLMLVSSQVVAGEFVVSLLGDTLYPVQLSPETLENHTAKLAIARHAYDAAPADADSIIWLGRRTAYLGRYHDAVAIYTRGIEIHPTDARMYRHRGHRYITTRRLGKAIGDFERAIELITGRGDEVEPDGLPNDRNIPTSTLHSNVWYHYGLVLYLAGDFDGALEAYRECMKVSNNSDMLVATSHWMYMTLRRLGRDADAQELLGPIHGDMDIIENDGYHRLLLMYKGELHADSLLAGGGDGLTSATVGYGVANWWLAGGDRDEAYKLFGEILRGEQWAAFGYIAAEAEVLRLGRGYKR